MCKRTFVVNLKTVPILTYIHTLNDKIIQLICKQSFRASAKLHFEVNGRWSRECGWAIFTLFNMRKKQINSKEEKKIMTAFESM